MVELRAFCASQELGPLLSYDAEHGTSLAANLAVFLEASGNEARAASRAHLARPTFYQRLALIERILEVSLADPGHHPARRLAHPPGQRLTNSLSRGISFRENNSSSRVIRRILAHLSMK